MSKPRPKEPWTRGDKAIIVGVVLAVALTATFAVVDMVNSAVPSVYIPMATMPNPNGFDYTIAAAQSSVEGYPMKGSIVPGWTPPQGNGALPSRYAGPYPYHAPAGPFPRSRVVVQPKYAGKPDLRNKKTMALAVALLKANAGVETSLQQAFKYPYLTPSVRSYSQPLPYLARFRRLSRALSFQADVEFARGGIGAGMTSALDVIHLGNLVPRGGIEIHSMVGSSCQAIGRSPLWHELPLLDAKTARNAASEMEKDDADYVSCVDTLNEDKLAGEAGLVEILRQPNWQSTFKSVVGANTGQNTDAVQDYLSSAMISKRSIMSSYVSAVDAEIAAAKRPYNANPPPVPVNPIVEALLVEDREFRFNRTYNQAENRLLMTACALRAYRLDHGQYPASLSLLVPGYLHAVPLDPFTASSPLAYRLSTKSYILYSVGPDTIDDGGRAVIEVPSDPNSDGRVQVNSKGDIVAGIDL